MIKLPVLLRVRKRGSVHCEQCTPLLGVLITSGTPSPFCKMGACSSTSFSPAFAISVLCMYTVRGPAFRWGDSPGTCIGLEVAGIGAAAGWIPLWLVRCEYHHLTSGPFCQQEHEQDFLSSTVMPTAILQRLLALRMSFLLLKSLKLVCMLQNGGERCSSLCAHLHGCSACADAYPQGNWTRRAWYASAQGTAVPRGDETWQERYKDNSARQVVKCNFGSHAGKGREKRD